MEEEKKDTKFLQEEGDMKIEEEYEISGHG